MTDYRYEFMDDIEPTPYNTPNHAVNAKRPKKLYCLDIHGYCKRQTCYMCEFWCGGLDRQKERKCPYDGNQCDKRNCNNCARMKKAPVPHNESIPHEEEEPDIIRKAKNYLAEIMERDKK